MNPWLMPQWVIRSLLGLVNGRRVQGYVGGKLGLIRTLRWGLGMGGPGSPFLWGLAYDPIITGVGAASKAECFTYVDDLAGLVAGPRQAMQLLFLLIAVGHAAGLRIDAHTCSWVCAAQDIHRVRALLDPFPLVVSESGTLPMALPRATP